MPTKNRRIAKEDEPTDPVFAYLKILKSQRRIALLKTLLAEKKPMTFMELLRKTQIPKQESPDASYHLTALKDKGIVGLDSTKYFLTSFGAELLGKFFEMEDVLATFSAPIMIRTSRYSMEPFSEQKIAESLIGEANMPPDLATEVARDTRIRLQRAEVKYLTAPLIREYINAILIEKHLEEYRHKLTRLGVPGYDIHQRLQKRGVGHLSEIQRDISRETLEQFALLRVFSKQVADAILQQLVGVPNLALFPYLPEEVVVPWPEAVGEIEHGWDDLLLEILELIYANAPRASRHLVILFAPPPGPKGFLNPARVQSLGNMIEETLQIQNKVATVIFRGSLPEVPGYCHCNGNQSNSDSALRFRYELPDDAEVLAETPGIDSMVGFNGRYSPVFETIFCNLLLFPGPGDSVADLGPFLRSLAEIAREIIEVKLTSLVDYTGDSTVIERPLIRLRPIGLPEITHFLRGFDIDQTRDSEQFAISLLNDLLEVTRKEVGGVADVILGQPCCGSQLESFARGAITAHPDLTRSMSFYLDVPACSPGFLRPAASLTQTTGLDLVARTIAHLPGEFFINVPPGDQIDRPALLPVMTTSAQNIFIFCHKPRVNLENVAIPLSTYFF